MVQTIDTGLPNLESFRYENSSFQKDVPKLFFTCPSFWKIIFYTEKISDSEIHTEQPTKS